MGLLNLFKFKIRRGKLLECKSTDSIIEIPKRVKIINPYVFSFTKAREIIVSKNVEEIGNNCFANNKNIYKVTMPNTNIELGNDAFIDDVNLVEVKLSSRLGTIPARCFSGCIKLKGIKNPANLTIIEENAFYRCKNMDEFIFEFPLIAIKSKAFAESGLTKVHLKDSRLTSISSGAFFRCLALKELTTNDSLKHIAREAFSECKRLRKVTLNFGLLTIEADAFKACDIKEIIIPNTVTNIGEKAFFFNAELESLKLPKYLRIIEKDCFSQCKQLSNIILPEKLHYIRDRAFMGCKSIKEIHFPSSLKRISKEAFANCSLLENVYIDSEDIYIEKGAFTSCYNLKNIFYKGVKINVSNFEVDLIDEETLEYLIKNQDEISKIEMRIDIDTLDLLKENNLWDEFINDAYYKNYRHLYAKLFYNNKGSLESKRCFFNFCYNLGVFDKKFSQKSSVIIESLIDNKLLQSHSIVSQLGAVGLEKLDDRAIEEITWNNGAFLRDIVLYSKKCNRFVGACLHRYNEVQFTNTTNKGAHKRLKPTLTKFINYFKEDKFAGAYNKEDKDLAAEIGKFFDDQETFDKAKEVMDEFRIMGIKKSLISEKYRKEVISQIQESKQKYSQAESKMADIFDRLYYEFLRKDDAINLTVGKYCNLCCGHINGIGENLCFASVLDPNTQTLVIKNAFNEIVSKATFSINKQNNAMIINSIQINDNLSKGKEALLVDKYNFAIQKFLSAYNKEHKEQIHRVYLGISRSALVWDFKPWQQGFSKSIDYNKYSRGKDYDGDWKEKQICIYDSKIISK